MEGRAMRQFLDRLLVGSLPELLLDAGDSWPRFRDPLVFEHGRSFVVGDMPLPAGQYQVRRVSDDPRLVRLTNIEGTLAVFVAVGQAPPLRIPPPAAIFATRGDRDVLESLWDGRGRGVTVLRARAADCSADAPPPD
jgi:hypothetical protein